MSLSENEVIARTGDATRWANSNVHNDQIGFRM